MPFAKELSVIIPGRNEQFMRRTIEDVLAHMKADTEIIAVCDGSWPDPVIQDHPRVKIVHTTKPIGQRAATNVGAQLSRAKYVMKLDAHCSVEDEFDVKLIADMQPDWTVTPRMYRLHVYDWRCNECGHGTYQGSRPEKCEECGAPQKDIYMHMVWEPKWKVGPTVSWRFDSSMHFQYWTEHRKRPEVVEQAKTGLIETMSCIGCCFFMERERFLALGGMDEGHGSWGQYGAELACKAWLSGGKLITNLNTWVAHLFRTGNFSENNESTFPYPLSGDEQEFARKYSRDLWMNNRWSLQKYPLSWLVERFSPVTDWDEEAIQQQKERERDFVPAT